MGRAAADPDFLVYRAQGTAAALAAEIMAPESRSRTPPERQRRGCRLRQPRGWCQAAHQAPRTGALLYYFGLDLLALSPITVLCTAHRSVPWNAPPRNAALAEQTALATARVDSDTSSGGAGGGRSSWLGQGSIPRAICPEPSVQSRPSRRTAGHLRRTGLILLHAGSVTLRFVDRALV